MISIISNWLQHEHGSHSFRIGSQGCYLEEWLVSELNQVNEFVTDPVQQASWGTQLVRRSAHAWLTHCRHLNQFLLSLDQVKATVTYLSNIPDCITKMNFMWHTPLHNQSLTKEICADSLSYRILSEMCPTGYYIGIFVVSPVQVSPILVYAHTV